MRHYSLFSIVGLLLAVTSTSNAGSVVERAATLAGAVKNVLELFQAAVDKGIYLPIKNNSSMNLPLVTLPGNATISLGLVTLPLDFLCKQEGLLLNLTCHVCSYDCTFVHNKYGGQCGNATDPLPGSVQEVGPVCVCNDTPPPNPASIKDLQAQCGSLVDAGLLDALIDKAVAIAFRERMLVVQCPPDNIFLNPFYGVINSVGCATDCTTNHNYRNGTCGPQLPVATYALEAYEGFTCNCAH